MKKERVVVSHEVVKGKSLSFLSVAAYCCKVMEGSRRHHGRSWLLSFIVVK